MVKMKFSLLALMIVVTSVMFQNCSDDDGNDPKMRIDTLAENLTSARGITVDDEGNAYVTNVIENNKSEVVKIAKDESITKVVGAEDNLYHFSAIDIDSENNLYVTQVYPDYVSPGNLYKIMEAGTSAVFSSNYVGPNGVTVNTSGIVYISDAHEIIELMPDKSRTTIENGFTNLSAITIDEKGNIYVADNGTDEIIKIPSDGSSPVVLANAEDGMNSPSGIAINSYGEIFVTNSESSSILKITQNGETFTLLEMSERLTGIAIDVYGNLYVTESYSNGDTYLGRVYKITLN